MASLYFTEIMESTKEIISRRISDIRVGSINSMDKMERSLHQPDSFYVILERVVSQNPNIVGCGIVFQENYYPEKGRWFEPYAVRERDGRITSRQLAGPDHDYFQFDWFQRVMATGESFWTAPYYDKDGGKTAVCTFVQPLKDSRDSIVGSFCLDLSLLWLNDVVKQLDEDNHLKLMVLEDNVFRSFIVDSLGTYLAHPDTTFILNRNLLRDAQESPDTIDDHAAKLILYDYQLYVDTEYAGNDVFMFSKRFKDLGWTIVTVVPQNTIKYNGYVSIFVMTVLICICMVVVFFVCRRAIRKVARPLVNFAASTDEIAKGNFDAPLPEVNSQDEIGLLRRSFANMQHSLTDYVEELKATTASKAAIEKELKIAHNIQMAMVPKKFPPYPKRTDIDIYGHMTPAKDVGGDLFDFYIRDEKLFFCVGDVSGKGVPAALFMTVTRNLFRSVSSHETMPSKMMQRMNDIMSEGNDMNMFVTLFIGVLDLTSGHLHYCNGGHDAPLLINSQVELLPVVPNIPVGLMPGVTFKGDQTDITPMTTIFLYTDGLTEAERTDGSLYGKDRLMAEARRAAAVGRLLPNDLVTHYQESIAAFVGDAEQSDDLTMFAVRYMKQSS